MGQVATVALGNTEANPALQRRTKLLQQDVTKKSQTRQVTPTERRGMRCNPCLPLDRILALTTWPGLLELGLQLCVLPRCGH